MVDLLFDNNVTLRMGDTRLNNITALTWNLNQSQKVFSFLTKSLDPEKYPWQTLHKSLLLLHTIILYGSEAAIDSCIQMFRAVDKLTSYNSALVKQRGLFSAGGTDYGAPVREEARIVCEILVNDDNIREARRSAHESADSLVPMGEDFAAKAAASQGKSNAAAMGFGQGMDSQYLGAGFDLSQVPGMYENRPDRYFDDKNDPRAQATAGDHQFTREALNKDSLLDLVFDDSAGNDQSECNLPEAEFLPALEKQKELEKKLAEQQQELQRLQMLSMQQQQQQQHQQHYRQSYQQSSSMPYSTQSTGASPQYFSQIQSQNSLNIFNDFNSASVPNTAQQFGGMNSAPNCPNFSQQYQPQPNVNYESQPNVNYHPQPNVNYQQQLLFQQQKLESLQRNHQQYQQQGSNQQPQQRQGFGSIIGSE